MTEQGYTQADMAEALEWLNAGNLFPPYAAQNYSAKVCARILNKYRPQPVDPDEAEAEEVCAKYYEAKGEDYTALNFRNGFLRGAADFQIALAAYKAGRKKGEGK